MQVGLVVEPLLQAMSDVRVTAPAAVSVVEPDVAQPRTTRSILHCDQMVVQAVPPLAYVSL